MEDDKTIVVLVVLRNDVHQLRPFFRHHVAGVDGWDELVNIHFCLQIRKLGHIGDEMVEVERLQRPSCRIASHAYGASCVDEQDLSRGLNMIFAVLVHTFFGIKTCCKVTEKTLTEQKFSLNVFRKPSYSVQKHAN